MNRWLATLGFGLLLVASAACGDDGTRADPGTPAGSTPADDPVDGRWFVGDGSSVTGHKLVEGTQLSIRFDAGQLTASTGCNTLQGAYVIEGPGTLVIDEIGSTAMGCDAALHEQDEWLSALLQDRPVVRVDGPTLMLSAGSVGATLTDREVAEPDRPLEGTTWMVDGQINGETASHSTVASPATLTFADGVLSVHTGCNTGTASYVVAGDVVTVGPVALTRMACDEPTMQREASIVAVLDGTVTSAIDAGRLTLTNGSIGLTLASA